MKKTISLLLALILCLSLCACGGSNDSPKATEAPVEAPESTELKIGDAFGTDSVECVIQEIIWYTSEEITMKCGFHNEFLNVENLFPDDQMWGSTLITKEEVSDYSFLCVKHTLQNIGKESVGPVLEPDGEILHMLPYGTMEVIYDDGYTFDFDSDGRGKYIGFTTPLTVLGDPVDEVMIIKLPNKVFENGDKPLKLKVMLPSSKGKVEEFIVSIR